jgi:Tfp pilus assembly protein PilF
VHPLFVRDDSLDITEIKEPGSDKGKIDEVIERMLTALHVADPEGGLTFTGWLNVVQTKSKAGKPTPHKRTFQRKLDILKQQKKVILSIATGKYQLSADYAAERAAFNAANS